MGGSLTTMPKATFDFRPSSHITEAKTKQIYMCSQMKQVGKTLQFSPNRVDLEYYFSGDKEWNYILRSISIVEYENRTNFNVNVKLYLQHYEQSSKDVYPCIVKIPPSKGPVDSDIVSIYEHPYPDDLTFYTYPTFREQILNPKRVKGNEKHVQYISTNSPFYSIYKDSYNDFNSYIYERMEKGLVDKSISTIVTAADPPYASFDSRIIDLFIQYIRETKYNLLQFIDFSSS